MTPFTRHQLQDKASPRRTVCSRRLAATSLKSIFTVPDISRGGAPAMTVVRFFFAASDLLLDEAGRVPTSWGTGRNLSSSRDSDELQAPRNRRPWNGESAVPLGLGALLVRDDMAIKHQERRHCLDHLEPVVLFFLKWVLEQIEILEVVELAQDCERAAEILEPVGVQPELLEEREASKRTALQRPAAGVKRSSR